MNSASSTEFRDIYDTIEGIIFIGTLHNEKHEKFHKLLIWCSEIELASVNHGSAIQQLGTKRQVEILKEVCRAYRLLDLACPRWSIWEEKSTKLYSDRRLKKSKTEMVRDSSACPRR